MTQTTHYSFNLPAGTDPASITPLNANMETLDSTLWNMQGDIDTLESTVGTVNSILADAIGEE
jgi:hypothetical protein